MKKAELLPVLATLKCGIESEIGMAKICADGSIRVSLCFLPEDGRSKT